MESDAIERVVNKLASILPEKLTEEQVKNLVADKVPKAFYFEMLIDLLTEPDTREDKIILAEARLLVKFITYRSEKKSQLSHPRTQF